MFGGAESRHIAFITICTSTLPEISDSNNKTCSNSFTRMMSCTVVVRNRLIFLPFIYQVKRDFIPCKGMMSCNVVVRNRLIFLSFLYQVKRDLIPCKLQLFTAIIYLRVHILAKDFERIRIYSST